MTRPGTTRQRLPAGERRAAIVAAATPLFAERGYGGTPTAHVAAAADCNETLLFRHFGSKRGLYLACIDAAWARVRGACEAAITVEPDAALHWRRMGATFLELGRQDPEPARLWTRALVETTGDPEIDEHLVELMREAHAYAAGVIERSRAAGGVLPEREPRSEAWTIISLAMLGTVGERLGPLLAADFAGVVAGHREWLTGSRS